MWLAQKIKCSYTMRKGYHHLLFARYTIQILITMNKLKSISIDALLTDRINIYIKSLSNRPLVLNELIVLNG